MGASDALVSTSFVSSSDLGGGPPLPFFPFLPLGGFDPKGTEKDKLSHERKTWSFLVTNYKIVRLYGKLQKWSLGRSEILSYRTSYCLHLKI